ncbi:hypothetical protein AKO1_015825 [Acrasis kona]|uniref:Carrier domain-containing protein n=1 Tax=Acrasis kona TaxID=1008807 RepID=A0AAW2ZJ70_9EUKA
MTNTITLPQAINDAFQKHGDAKLIGRKINKEYEYLTYKQVHQRVQYFRTGLVNLDAKIVGICCRNKVEWVIADLACLMQGIISVPYHYDSSKSDILHIINDSKIDTIVTEASLSELYTSVSNSCPSFKHLITLEKATAVAEDHKLQLHVFEEIEESGKNTKDQVQLYHDPNTRSLTSLMYTSGSTGKPKGVMMTQLGLLKYSGKGLFYDGKVNKDQEKLLMVSPLSHVAGRSTFITFMSNGDVVALYDGAIEKVFDEFPIVNPTQVAMTPQLFNVVYEDYEFDLQIAKEKNAEVNQEQILQKYSKVFGNNLRTIVCYGAKLSDKVLKFIKDCTGAKVIDGYGSTEASGVSANGIIGEGVDYKLVNVPEMGYLKTDKPLPRGELCVKSEAMFLGYLNNEEATKEAIDEEGYMRTGDIVELDEEKRSISIIDRKKNIFKLAQGKYVAPQGIEALMSLSSFVDSIYVYGTIEQSYLVAVVVPNWEHVDQFAKAKGITNVPKDDNERHVHFSKSDRLKKRILDEFTRIGKEHELHSFEVPKNLILEVEKFSHLDGRLTNTGKLSRFGCEKYYKSQLDGLYNNEQDKPKDEIGKMFSELFPGKIDYESALSDYGIDSLRAVRISNAIKKKFNVVIPTKILFNGHITFKDVISLIKNENYVDSNSQNQVDWLAQVELPKDLSVPESNLSKSDLLDLKTKKNILLTGANGFLGVYLLVELLQKSSANVHCLIRAHDDKSAMDRIKSSLKYFEVEWKSDYDERIKAIHGTFSHDNLDVDEDVYSWLCDNIDAIYHNGANVNWMLSYDQLKNDNVDGVVRLIRLATTRKLKPLHYISSIGAVTGLPGMKSEEEVHEEKEALYKRLDSINGYSSGKWVSEQIIKLARAQGVPITVFRPGMIGFGRRNGSTNVTDWVGRLLRGSIALGAYPKVDVDNLDEVPVDQVAEIIVAVSQLPEALEKYSYHVSNNNGNSIHLNHGFELIRKELYPDMKALSFDEWITKVSEEATGEKDDAIWPMIGLFSNGLPVRGDVDISNENLKQAIKSTGIELKKIDDELMVESVKFMKRQNIIKE